VKQEMLTNKKPTQVAKPRRWSKNK